MSTRRAAILLIALALAPLVESIAPAHAQELVDRRDRERRERSSGISLDQAVEMARSRYGARVVRAETIGGVHHIRLLNTDGKVWTVRVSAETGAMF